MDESAYRRVMSRNLDEFGSAQNRDTNPSVTRINARSDFTPGDTNNSSFFTSSINSVTMNRAAPNPIMNRPPTYGGVAHYNRSTSSDYSSSEYGRKKGNINLKQIKAVGLNCAKTLTNKLISFSNAAAGSSSSSNAYSTSSTAANNKYSCSSREVYVINSNKNSTPAYSAAANYPASTANYHSTTSYNAARTYPDSNVVDNRMFTLKCIADRIATTQDQIKTHRELVAVIERCLTHSDYLVEITIEKDRFGAPTLESINRFTLINKVLLDKILIYIKGRRDCCIFVVKFTTWRMRTTKKPEEVILSLELLARCMNEMGGYFLSLFTKSLMKTLRKLLFATNLKHSITSGVKRKITKFLGKANYVHPGISTDIRIHIFKSKILYMVQLYYDVFLFDQGEYVVFYDGYKDMRIRGIKFPAINPEDKNQVNTSYTFASFGNSAGASNANAYGASSYPDNPYGRSQYGRPGGGLSNLDDVSIDLNELDQLLYNINTNNYDVAYIEKIREKLLTTINSLSNRSSLSEHHSQLLDKILKLNDSLLMLCSTSEPEPANSGFTKVSINLNDMTVGIERNVKLDLLELGPSGSFVELSKPGSFLELGGSAVANSSETKSSDEFDFFPPSSLSPSQSVTAPGASVGKDKDVKESLDDIFNFVSLNAVGDSGKADDKTPLSDEDQNNDDDEEDEDELINNFINSPSFSMNAFGMGATPSSARKEPEPPFSAPSPSSFDFLGKAHLPVVGAAPKPDDALLAKDDDFALGKDNTVAPKADAHSLQSQGSAETAENDAPAPREKNLSQLVSELDNLELDFGHMSVNNF